VEKELVVTTKLEDVSSVQQRLKVEVPPQLLKKSVETAMNKMKNEVKIPGFRKGKVPTEMLKQRLGGDFKDEVVRQVVRDTYPDAVKLADAKPISDPNIEPGDLDIEQDKPFNYDALFEIYPTVEAKDYNGLKLEREKVEVTDKEVDLELKGLQRQMTQLEPAPDAKLGKGVLGRIDFTGTAGGQKFEGCEAKDFIVDLDEGNLMPEFEKQIVGMKEKEEKDVEFEYPKDYFNKEIAGKKGMFHVVLKELRKKVVPELDDSFAKDLGPYKKLDEVKQILKDRIIQIKENHQRGSMHRQILEQLAANQPIEIPDAMVSRELGHMLEELAHQLEQQGKTLQDSGVDASAFVKEHVDEATLRVRGMILTNSVADQEKITVSDDEVNQRITAMAAQSGQPEAKVRQHMEQNDLIPGLKGQMLIEKTLDFLVEKAKIKEKKPKKDKK
jgi:trigger factor